MVSINEPLEDTPSGRLLEGIIEVSDEFYSANLSQDVVRGMRESASRGFSPGSPAPYGYHKVRVQDGNAQRSKLELDPSAAQVVARMFRECLSGQGLVEITRSLNRDGLTTRSGQPWSKPSLHKILHNEAYAGVLVWDRRKRRQGAAEAPPPVRVEGAWPAIVDRETFDQAQARLAARAPRITHPRVVHSEYVLSGMIRCRPCGAAMIGHAVKSGKFFYYMCGNARRRGRGTCQTPLLPKEKIEGFVIDRIKQYILTEENLEELARLTNEELAQSCSAERERLDTLEAQLSEAGARLAKLYEALETGEFKSGELASRIRDLFQKKEELAQARAGAQEALKGYTVQLADPEVVKSYVQDLKGFLAQSGIIERKAFLRSFVEHIEVDGTQVTVFYTIPMLPGAPEPASEEVGVLPFVHNGVPGNNRTPRSVG